MAENPTIPFTRGAPSLDIIDVEGLSQAAAKAFADDPAGATAYGTAVGYVPLREWIAEQHNVEPEQVMVTNGSMQADAFLFELLVGEGDAVVVEAPSYDRTLLNLRNRKADVRPLPLQTDGVDVAAFGQLLSDGLRPTLAHIIPNFQNPAGYTLSADKRAELLRLTDSYGFTLFEDDPYINIRFEGEALPTMLSQDTGDHVVYASSFSKTVCPGIRCGYLVGPKELIGNITKLATTTYISPNMVAQAIINQFCRSGQMDRSVATVRTALKQRRDTLAAALRREIPDATFSEPEGGYFMWLQLPDGISVEALTPVAAEHGVAYVKGSDFLLEGGDSAVRLAFSGVTPEQIEEGITRLGAAVNQLRS